MFGWLLAAAVALGGQVAAYSPGLDAVSRGDLALYEGERERAHDFFVEAIHTGEAAAEAMARLRLLGLSGNLGTAVHGPRLEDALARCRGDWCALARSDFHRIVPEALGADREQALQLARSILDELPGPALARLYLLTGETSHLTSLEKQADLDGLGQALLSWGGDLPGLPGTWFLGVGVSGTAGIGVGGNAVFFHPDLFWRRWWLQSGVWLSSRGGFGGSLLLEGPSRLAPSLSASASDSGVDFYEGSTRTSLRIRRGEAALGPVLQSDTWKLGIPLVVSVGDGGAGWQRVAGVGVGLARDHRRGRGSDLRGTLFSVESQRLWGDFQHLSVFADSRGFLPLLGGVVGARLTLQGALIEGVPVWMLPVVGGGELHRGAWYARWRSPGIATADLEQRWMILPRLGAVVFGNVAWVQQRGSHPGGGMGLRLVLPPEDWNIVRLDLARSDTGWSLTAGWGEAF